MNGEGIALEEITRREPQIARGEITRRVSAQGEITRRVSPGSLSPESASANPTVAALIREYREFTSGTCECTQQCFRNRSDPRCRCVINSASYWQTNAGLTKHNANAQMDSSWMFECESPEECPCRGPAVFECHEMHTVYENVKLAEMVRCVCK